MLELRWRIAGLVILSACETVFPLEAPAAVDAGLDAAEPAFDHCSPSSIDPLRYAVITNPNIIVRPEGETMGTWSWSEARSECQLRGMDLAVFNDGHELGRSEASFGWPYWIGELTGGTGWTAVDGCTPFTTAAMHTTGGPMCAVVTDSLELGAFDCSGVTEVVKAALCETPSPATAACVARDPALATYTASETPMTFADARTFCKGLNAHVVVTDSFEKWKRLSNLTHERHLSRVWVGSTFDGTTWVTETGCPAVYSWTETRPDLGSGATCAATSLRLDSDTQELTVEGLAVTGCTDGAVYALCESN